MVLGVCREVLGNTHDAQDAFQATFLVLARKAASVRKTDSVASWLHGVALRVAVRAKAHATRRRVYERRSAVMRAAEFASERGSPECWPELHEEIARLPQHYREPVVLCYLEGLSTEAAALRIGCPKGTVLSRLSRARERLRGRLDRRGLGLPAVGLAANLTSTVRTALPARLLDTTVRASLSFAGRLPAEATFASATATTLARGMLYTMTVSKLAILGAAGLAGVFALGSAQTFGWLGGLERAQEPTQSASGTTDPQEALARSVNNLESELDESARRNAGMRKELQEIRAGLNALLNAPKRTALVARAALTQLANALEAPKPTEAVARLADVLKHHPAKPSADQGWNYQLYMLDLVEGGTTLIADEPIPDLICSGLPAWSHDGNRIVFDTAGSQWPLARLMAIEVRDGRPTFTDLGEGNHPTFSPDDKRIAFLLHPRAVPGAEPGIWVMQADGTGRRLVGEFGAPFWSPDGREFLINDYSDKPTTSTVINLDTKQGGVVQVPGHQIISWPSWAGPGTLVSVLTTDGKADSIALLDVRKPSEARIIEVLWKRGDELDVTPRWPVYQPGTRRCIFVGAETGKRELYCVERGESLGARRLEVVEHLRPGMTAQQLGGLSFSPDGRYLLFQANRPDRR